MNNKARFSIFGQWLRQKREAYGLTAGDLSRTVKRNNSYISQVENGTAHPSVDQKRNNHGY
jgi:transcriptional regulator with XRE-family HTH domain